MQRLPGEIPLYVAAALLMPGKWVLAAWHRGHQQVSTLAELFQVSPQAMARRLATLGLPAPYLTRYNRRAA